MKVRTIITALVLVVLIAVPGALAESNVSAVEAQEAPPCIHQRPGGITVAPMVCKRIAENIISDIVDIAGGLIAD